MIAFCGNPDHNSMKTRDGSSFHDLDLGQTRLGPRPRPMELRSREENRYCVEAEIGRAGDEPGARAAGNERQGGAHGKDPEVCSDVSGLRSRQKPEDHVEEQRKSEEQEILEVSPQSRREYSESRKHDQGRKASLRRPRESVRQFGSNPAEPTRHPEPEIGRASCRERVCNGV